jgi:chemotaxis methyl-accepting protein methylase
MTSESGAIVDSSLSRAVHWQVADAFSFESRHPWDLILCRNLAIYLHAATAARLWNRLWNMLAPGGYLVVGKAEKPTVGFIRVAPCVYRKPSL